MRVTSMIPQVQYDIQQSASSLATAEQQVSTGLRVQQLSDDPSASANMVRSLMESANVDQYTKNVSSLQSSMQTASSALSQVVTAMNSAISSGTAGASDSLAASNRDSIASQVEGLLQTVVSSANTSYQGSYLFGGSASSTPPFVPASLSYSSANGTASTPLTTSTALTAGSETTISDASTGESFTYTAKSGDTIATLQQAVAGAVSAGTLSAGTTATINANGQLSIGQGSSGSGVAVSTNDSALGSMSADSGTQVADSYAYVGNSDVNHVSVGSSLSVASNVPGSTLFGNGSNTIASLTNLIKALKGGDTTAISTATQAVSSALTSFDTLRVPLDEGVSELSSQETYLSSETITLTTQQTALTGISTAEAATNLAQAELDNNAVLAAAAKALPQTLLQYLQ
ncbi:flagellar hook-associated protein 3 [Bryocella elongata]|uniref:Flagellar hook-associated protein 3 n=1 Tax=Bryocella elongata TaxID=863522 RepID=A0A1H5TMW7_9BACT|nr:flagellar hook-associated protein FlgL [Bryocella elongata]SEF63357.1 flagellar hook-associated protein 3 [Bryocella elongata]